MGEILEIHGGDVSCVYHKISGYYEVYITRYGESGRYKFNTLESACDLLKDCFGFDDELISDFKRIIFETDD